MAMRWAIGRRADAAAAYRRAIEQAPQLGEVWWSLANLKTHRFTPDDVAVMRAQLGRDDLDDEDRLHLDFALAKALEDEGDYAGAFAEYAKGNAIRQAQLRHSADETSDQAARSRALLGPGVLRGAPRVRPPGARP